jgi:hypothetical protein
MARLQGDPSTATRIFIMTSTRSWCPAIGPPRWTHEGEESVELSTGPTDGRDDP